MLITKEATVKAAVKGWVLQKASVPESHCYFPVIHYIYFCLFFLTKPTSLISPFYDDSFISA